MIHFAGVSVHVSIIICVALGYGVLLGTRHYLVARDMAADATLRRFRMDRIEKAEITNEWFKRDPGFDLEAYAAKSFGSFHLDAEFTRIVWRFAPASAATAREFEFHPIARCYSDISLCWILVNPSSLRRPTCFVWDAKKISDF